MIAAILAAAPSAAMAGPAGSDGPRDSLPLAGGTVVNPDWTVKPTGEELQRYFPPIAAELGLGGMVRLQCDVALDGTLGGCSALQETPIGMGFGEAALNATKYFRMRPMTVNGVPVAGATVVIPLTFGAPIQGIDPIPPVIDEPTDAATLVLARELVTATGLKAHLVAALQTSIDSRYSLLAADATPQQALAIQSLKQATVRQADHYVEFVAKEYAATLPAETIKAITAFYLSPAGKAWAEEEGGANKTMQMAYAYIYRRAATDAREDFCKTTQCGPTQ